MLTVLISPGSEHRHVPDQIGQEFSAGLPRSVTSVLFVHGVLSWQNGGMADMPNSLLSTVPAPTFEPDVIAYQLLIEHKPLWSKLRQQRSDFVRVATGVTIYRAQARQQRTAMGGTLLELQTAYSVPGHGHFIRLAEKTLGSAHK